MVFAMMRPTSLPLIALFQTMTRDRRRPQVAGGTADRRICRRLGLVWSRAVHLGDLALHQVTGQSVWLSGNYRVLGATILVLAGAYQLTPLKYHCVDKCRSPLSFIISHGTGKSKNAVVAAKPASRRILCRLLLVADAANARRTVRATSVGC